MIKNKKQMFIVIAIFAFIIILDGTMKLVTQNNINSISFNALGQINFYTDANTTSYMHEWLNEDFYDTHL